MLYITLCILSILCSVPVLSAADNRVLERVHVSYPTLRHLHKPPPEEAEIIPLNAPIEPEVEQALGLTREEGKKHDLEQLISIGFIVAGIINPMFAIAGATGLLKTIFSGEDKLKLYGLYKKQY